jgi:Tfp pilus assembly protein PilX
MGKYINSAQRQRGVVLFIALIALVAITLASIALMRSVDTANVIAGNFAFRESTIHTTDLGTENAIAALPTLIGTTGKTASANQYFPVRKSVDALGIPDIDWRNVPKTSITGTGNDVQYVVERMCDAVVNPTTGATISANGPDQTNRNDVTDFCITTPQCSPGVSINTPPFCVAGDINYRITTRVVGPRGTVSVVQSIVTM